MADEVIQAQDVPADQSQTQLAIIEWQPLDVGKLKASFTIELLFCGLQISGLAYCVSGRRRWVSMPRRKIGEQKVHICWFVNPEWEEWFRTECLKTIDSYLQASRE